VLMFDTWIPIDAVKSNVAKAANMKSI